MDPLTPGQRAFFNMITKPGTVYAVTDGGPPGIAMTKAYKFNDSLELVHWYSGRAGWAICSYTSDWGSFIEHWGTKLKMLSDEEAKRLK